MDEPIRPRDPSDGPPAPSSTDAAEAFAGYLDELERLCEAATPGPWSLDEHGDGLIAANGDPIAETWSGTRRLDDARFVEVARHALPKLIAAVRELEANLLIAEALVDKQNQVLKQILESWERAKRKYEAAAADVVGFKERAETAEAERCELKKSVRELAAELDLTDKRLRWETTKDDSERSALERELFGGGHD